MTSNSDLEEASAQEVITPAAGDTIAPPAEAPPVNPVEEAATHFTQLLPYVRKFCHAMSAKSQTRVMHAMAEFPLGATKPRLLNEKERQLFQILQQLQGHKSTILQSFIQQQTNLEQLKTQTSQETGQTAATAAETETNGGN